MDDKELNGFLNNFYTRFPDSVLNIYRIGVSASNDEVAKKAIKDLDALIESEGFDLDTFQNLNNETRDISWRFSRYQLKLHCLRGGISKDKILPAEDKKIKEYIDSLIAVSSKRNRMIEPFYYKMIDLGYSHYELTG